jgi:hypothetical protein
MKQIVDRLTSISYRDSPVDGDTAPYVSDSVKSLMQDMAENVGVESIVSGQSD